MIEESNLALIGFFSTLSELSYEPHVIESVGSPT